MASFSNPSTNPGVFDYRKFLSHKGIYTVLSVYSINGIKKVEGNPPGFLPAMIANLHRRIDSIITEAMPDAKLESMVLKGVMLGRRKELPQEVQDMFIASGVVHVLETQYTKNFCRQYPGKNPPKKTLNKVQKPQKSLFHGLFWPS